MNFQAALQQAANNSLKNISFEDAIQQAIKRCGLNLQLDKHTPGDGNCFSHAVIQQCQWSDVRPTLNRRTLNVLNSLHPYFELKQGVKNFMIATKNIIVKAFKVEFDQTVGLSEKVSWVFSLFSRFSENAL